MNAARLAEIEALANAATPGPWEVDHVADMHLGGNIPSVQYKGARKGDPLGTYGFTEQNAAFIAEARTAVPDLASALREARELAEFWHDEAARFAHHVRFALTQGKDIGAVRIALEEFTASSAAFAATKETW